ncbi:hypothetical protein [Trujillonella humicola]|uniref:hypothetical protein n=1 Tax=Trujillonella humicola TaxID=3383699 RepID=UPI00390620B1
MTGARAAPRVAALLAAALLGLSGCGGDDDSSSADGTGDSPSAATTAATSAADGTTGPGPSRTPSPAPASTATPTSGPPPGTEIPGESLTAEQVADLQEEVDEGHQPWRTDVGAVAASFVAAQLGWDDASVALADPHTAEVTSADGRIVVLQLRQPAREGEGGIWVVTSGVWVG